MSITTVINPHQEILSNGNFYNFNKPPSISTHALITIIANESNVVILDLRSSERYQESHIINSKHSNCSTNLMTKKSIMNLKREIASTGIITNKVILYNQGKENYNHCLLDFITKLNCTFFTLEGGFECFAKYAPKNLVENGRINIFASPTNIDVVSEDVMSAKISQIQSNLYLGNANDSANLKLLKSLNITGILCVTANTKLYFEEMNIFEYKRIKASDSGDQNLLEYFEESIQFIEDNLKNNGKVLVHCLAGVSRSVTIVLAYLIKRHHMKVHEALKYVSSIRSIASPNLNFLGQLERFYNEQIIGKNTL